MHTSVQVHDLVFVPLLSPAEIGRRVQEIGAGIRERYHNEIPLFISVLSGAFVFAADLIRAYDSPCEIGFVKLTSYSGTQSEGRVQSIMGLEHIAHLNGRHVVVVEDIIDSGRTLHYFLELLKQHEPASICVAACLRKPEAMEFNVQADFIGFDIENRFVVGYGLDYDGHGRYLPGIYCCLNENI